MDNKLRSIFSARPKKTIYDEKLKLSAVLIPLFCKDSEYHILFTKRSFKVAHHRGQISFPGGAHNEEDADFLETALRESWEEIGLNPEDVEVIGELDDTATDSSNYVIKPFLGIIPYPYHFTRNPNEILEIFDIPISHLLNKSKCSEEVRQKDNGPDTLYFYKYKKKVIWGATANILNQFLDTMKEHYYKADCGVRD